MCMSVLSVVLGAAVHAPAGVRSLAFSYSAFCNEANMHSAQAASFSEAVKTAAAWLQSPDFIWSAQQVDAMT